jgi:hypothetical protein
MEVSMLTRSELDGLTSHLEHKFEFTFVHPDNTLRETAVSFLKFLATLVPGSSVAVDALLKHLDEWSSTLPLPFGTVCLLSKGAVADPLVEATTKCHEATHAFQIQMAGKVQSTVDYLGSGHMRASREAKACVGALWVKYLLTGEIPDAEHAIGSLKRDLYHLSGAELALAEGEARYALSTIRSNNVPPYAVVMETLLWMRANAPDKIVPSWCKTIHIQEV